MPKAQAAPLVAELLRFAVAGSIGFIVDLTILLALSEMLDGHPLVARLVSFAVAVIVTWLINRLWTFRQRVRGRANLGSEFARYGLVALTAGVANYVIYALLVIAGAGSGPFRLAGALAAGVAAGMLINFFGARALVFGRSPALEGGPSIQLRIGEAWGWSDWLTLGYFTFAIVYSAVAVMIFQP